MTIDKRTALAAHNRLIAEFGGVAGLRDEGLLESALACPENVAAYVKEAGPFRLAAALAFGIIRNHPFLDGNKRTGAVLGEMFLWLAGYVVEASEEDKYGVYAGVAASSVSEEELAAWLERRAAKR